VRVAEPLPAGSGSTAGSAPIERVDVLAYELPTDGPGGAETDGTLEWAATTMVVCLVHAGGETGLGYTYGHRACALLIEDTLAPAILGCDATAVGSRWEAMSAAIRNAGRPGAGMMALSALDTALWDLAARRAGRPLVDLLDRVHDAVPVYGSGGFCNYPLERLAGQLGGWVESAIPRVKLKVSRQPERDPARLAAVRRAIGDDVELYVDANGALSRTEALAWSHRFRDEWGVSWFEEPVTSADIEGLRLVRERGPVGLDVAAGEYVFLLRDAVDLLEGEAVSCLQLDVTRCGGITGVLRAGRLAEAYDLDVSAHCAPQLSAHAFCALRSRRHLEYFHDHVRFEQLAFAGCLEPRGGELRPDRSRAGHGLELKRGDLEPHCIHRSEASR
jgi:L-alanine-DL-glutamate epimerase-like enolase superfamily enzyme